MTIFTISQTTRHFYLNYHHSGSNSLWIHSEFMRNLQFGLREVICFLSISFLAYGTRLADNLSLEYFLPIISILCLQETFGSTLSYSYQITLTITPLAIFLFVVQKLGLDYHGHFVSEFIMLLFTSFCISYGCTQIQTKKLSLLYNALYFASHVYRRADTLILSFELLGIYILGMSMASLISFTIFPIFATFDIENRFNYSLLKLQQMHTLLIRGFLCHDKTSAHMFLTRASMLENLVNKALDPIQSRIDEARFEPTEYLKRRFNRKRRAIIDLTLHEQQNLITSLMVHVCSLQLMVKHCVFNDYHKDFTYELESSLLHLGSCQSTFISSLTASSSVSQDEFTRQTINIEEAFRSIRSAYVLARLQQIEHVLESAATIQYADHISHEFFLFELGAIVQILTNGMRRKILKNNCPKIHESKTFDAKVIFRLDWPRLSSALKSTIIIGVGAIFVLETHLAKAFENGQWILFTLCVTLSDTVGGAFTTMKMRLLGTLLGSIWAYVTYLVVRDNVYQTIGMLAPWIFIFGYLKLLPNWGYTATVAAFTPVLITLGRLPFGNQRPLPVSNFVLTRIEESFIGITIAAVLTLLIFPIFAIDSLKDNIENTLTMCRESIISIHSVYDNLFHRDQGNQSCVHIGLEEKEPQSCTNDQRNLFHRLTNLQRTLIEHAALEPVLWCINNGFSTKLYNMLAQQQINTYRMLHSIDGALMRSNEHSKIIRNLQINAARGNFLPNFRAELTDLCKQLISCFHVWISYFNLSQTNSYQLFRQCNASRRTIIENDFKRHEQCLIELHQSVNRLEARYQEGLNRLVQYYLDCLLEGELCSAFVPYANNNEADLIFIAYHAMHYSITQLAQSALTLGQTVHTIFELETTPLYRSF
ncbi:unnamed protein product [Rotaria magnacalcarata]|uniref:Integral membrane bound transporter domain-containing protein n=2 Tax=Rotaria magnacalcarata TaxID=392030 RepID=A0A816UYN4_9BILA|nr:unnamed protein product [Rotaria magnacalcarata]CAF2119338.1 unnamed protein product [Rotaria magnacalcarata]CAF3873375.1 unnamed protein product [Rotaria magnacalcarata]CAF4098741.1 unnamed protein product [Rotaria magnacalcarata]